MDRGSFRKTSEAIKFVTGKYSCLGKKKRLWKRIIKLSQRGVALVLDPMETNYLVLQQKTRWAGGYYICTIH